MADREDFATAVGALVRDKTVGVEITTQDLDTLTTPGPYWQGSSANATEARHYPFQVYGNLTVSKQHGTGANLMQIYVPSTTFADGFAIRNYRSTGWGAWVYFESKAATEALVAGTVGAKTESRMKSVP